METLYTVLLTVCAPASRKAEQTVEELSREDGPHKAVKFKEVYAKRFSTQYIALLKKFNTAYWRTPEYNYIRALVTVILGFVLGTLYWKIGHKK